MLEVVEEEGKEVLNWLKYDSRDFKSEILGMFAGGLLKRRLTN